MIIKANVPPTCTVRELLDRYGISVAELSRSTCIPYRTIMHWANGERTPPQWAMYLIERRLEQGDISVSMDRISTAVNTEMLSEIWEIWLGKPLDSSTVKHYRERWKGIVFGLKAVGVDIDALVDDDNGMPYGCSINGIKHEIDYEFYVNEFKLRTGNEPVSLIEI